MEIFYQILKYTSIYIPIIPIILGIYKFWKLSKTFKLILLYPIVSIIYDSISVLLRYGFDVSTIPFINSLTYVELLIFYLVIRSLDFSNKKLFLFWKISYIMSFIGLIISSVYQDSSEFNVLIVSLEAIVLVVSILVFLVDSLLFAPLNKQFELGIFIVLGALLVMFTFTAGIYSVVGLDVLTRDTMIVLWRTKFGIFILFNLVLTFAIYQNSKSSWKD